MKVLPVNQLLSKSININIKQFEKIRNRYKSVNIPGRAAFYDLITMKNKAGKQIEILTFRDGKNKDIIKRYVYSISQKDIKMTERTYNKLPDTYVVKKDEGGEIVLPVKGRKISSVTKKNGQYNKKSEEIQTVTYLNDGSKVLHISQVKSKPAQLPHSEVEEQSLFEYQLNKKRRGYQIFDCTKNKDGYFAETVFPRVKFEGFCEKTINQLIKDPYLLLHLHSFKQFKRVAPSIAYNPEHKPKYSGSIRWFKDTATDTRGRCVNKFDIQLNHHNIKNRYDVIECAAHEHEHCYQHEQEGLYQIYEMYKERGLNYDDVVLIDDLNKAKQYRQDFLNYTGGDKDYEAYSKQFVEDEARNAGSKALSVYSASSSLLKSRFPYAPDYLVGITYKDMSSFYDGICNNVIAKKDQLTMSILKFLRAINL